MRKTKYQEVFDKSINKKNSLSKKKIANFSSNLKDLMLKATHISKKVIKNKV